MLRQQSPRAAFHAGTRRLQSELIRLAPPRVSAAQCAFLAAELERHGCLAESDATAAEEPDARFCELLVAVHAALLREARFFFPETAELVGPPGDLAVAIPKIPSGTELAAELFQRLAPLCAQSALQGAAADPWIARLREEIAGVPQPLLAATHMVRAAYELGLPILEWHSVFLQVGYGARAVALTGSISQDTSSIGVHFAREKAKANVLLARAGFPIAEGGLVRDLAEARERAAALGFPVVVKPADRDGGTAVSSDIRSDAELDRAFARARAAGPRVMVEKHVPGTDYRLLFFRDELLVALERTPGGVTGNGADTVVRLIERTNAERVGTPLEPIAFDGEAQLLLRRQGLTTDSVPADGAFVPLRRAANHALGGTIRRFDAIHPDNVDLARRAMRLLRLDIAGVDLILPDATRSWHEAGGAVCEVNAQPFVGEPVKRDFYKEILAQLVPGGGRIPLVLAVGTLEPDALAALEAEVPGLAIIDRHGARRGGTPLSVARMSWPHACQAALYDQDTAAALCLLDPARPAPPVSPADRFSAAVVLEAPEEIGPFWRGLLGRAETVLAVEAARPALRAAGLDAEPLGPGERDATLAALLGEKPIPAAARTAARRRGTAPPARRTRR